VFYNEESFIYRERPTLSQRLGRTATIYHEVAHQWFGDLVTMQWFDDLWLKEGFATYMAAKMQASLDPASDAWKTFYLRNKPQAYAVDASQGTTPIWQRLENLDQAKSNYGAIVYNKAPSVLKQLNFLVGDSAFQAGLRDYLAKHAYGNATWRDLLSSVGTAAHRDLTAWGQSYILRPGVPVLEATLMRRAPNAAAHDSGATFVRLAERPARALSGPAAWPIRTRMVVIAEGGARQSAPVEVGPAPGRSDHYTFARLRTAPAAPALVFPNFGDEAYAITLLDAGSVAWTERHIAATDPLLRAMLWGALWDLVREARLAPARYVGLAMRELPDERDEQVAGAVLGRSVRAATRYLSQAQRDSVLPPFETMLLGVAQDRARDYGVRKSFLDAYVAAARTPAALGTLDAMLDHDDVAGLPLRAPTRWAIVTALVERGAPGAERRLAAESKRDSTSEGKRRAFAAGAARPDAATKADYFRRYFADRDLNEDWTTASLGAFNAPEQQALTLQYLTPALDSLRWVQKNRRIFFLGSWLDAFVNGHTTPAAAKRIDAFLAAHPSLPIDLRQKLLQSADELRRTVAIRAKYAGG
jgi:aminopeptidase N